MVNTFEVHIVSHYREDREPQLKLVLEGIRAWKNCIVRAVITSNTDGYAATGLLAPFAASFERSGHSLSLNVVEGLSNPRMLTWAHKDFIKPWLERASPGEDFFVYIEDDILLADANIAYFLKHRKILERQSLIPGFLRYEKRGDGIGLVDVVRPEYWQRDRTIKVGGQLYHANINPYWAGFILDKQGAQEYVASRSFKPDTSEFVAWNIQERAAMGLTYESPPAGLRTRIVVPIADGKPDPDCLVWHCSNNYSDADHPLMARLSLQEAYRRESLAQYVVRKGRAALARIARR